MGSTLAYHSLKLPKTIKNVYFEARQFFGPFCVFLVSKKLRENARRLKKPEWLNELCCDLLAGLVYVAGSVVNKRATSTVVYERLTTVIIVSFLALQF